MSNVVNLADYRPKTQTSTELRITSMTSKKLCEMMTLDELLHVSAKMHPLVFVDGVPVTLDKDDIEAEIRKRD